jgi:hypothetical protein
MDAFVLAVGFIRCILRGRVCRISGLMLAIVNAPHIFPFWFRARMRSGSAGL